MALYPLMLDLAGRRAVVVGGGRVGQRKVVGLLEAGASVTVVSPEACDRVRDLAGRGRVTWHRRPYAAGDLAGAVLAFAAADRREVNATVLADARAAGIPCNVADDPAACDFHVPSVVRRGDLLLAVSTGGASPVVARKIREALEARFGSEWEAYLGLLAAVRGALLALGEPADRNRDLFVDLAEQDLLSLLREGRWAEVERVLVQTTERHLGGRAAGRFTLEALGVAR